MSDVSQGPGWWLASDGKWYPPKESEEPPGPGWWLASDGKWYPPESKSTGAAAAVVAARPEKKTPTTAKKSVASKTSTTKTQAKTATRAQGKTATATSRAVGKQVGTSQGSPKKSVPSQKPSRGTPTASTTTRTVPTRAGAGLTPQAQIAQRDKASRADALVVASRRANAASRALASLSLELEKGRDQAVESTDPLGNLAMASPSTATDEAVTKPAPPSKPAPPTKPASPTKPGAPETKAAATRSSSDRSDAADAPLLELRPSALSGDLSRAGERLAIYGDRVETIDRAGQIREAIEGTAIADVVIQKRITGLVLSIEDVNGPVITIKGLTAPQAEQARALIMRKTRQFESVPVSAKTSSAAHRSAQKTPDASASHEISSREVNAAEINAGEVTGAPVASRTWLIEVDEADLLRKLADLHRAGVLDDDEFRDKVGVIHRIVNGETTTVSKH